MLELLSGQQLLTLANQVALASHAFEATPSSHLLEGMRDAVSEYSVSGLRSRVVDDVLRPRDRHTLLLRRADILKSMHSLEGEIWGHMVRQELVPLGESIRINSLLDGNATPEAISSGIGTAHRQIRAGFLSGFLWAAEIEPTAGRRYLKNVYLKPYPLLESRWNRPCFFKAEGDQEGGSYAIRGAINFFLHQLQGGGPAAREKRVVLAARSGLIEGLIRGAKLMGFADIAVYLQQNIHTTTLTNVKSLGAKPFLRKVPFDEIEETARRETENEPGSIFVPSRHPLLEMGFGTIGPEIESSLHRPASIGNSGGTSVIVPSPDASLLAGLAHYFRGRSASVFRLDAGVANTGTALLGERHLPGGSAVVTVFPDHRSNLREIAQAILSRG